MYICLCGSAHTSRCVVNGLGATATHRVLLRELYNYIGGQAFPATFKHLFNRFPHVYSTCMHTKVHKFYFSNFTQFYKIYSCGSARPQCSVGNAPIRLAPHNKG